MNTKFPMSFYIFDTIVGLIITNAEAMNAWPTVTLFRKNNKIAIGLHWDQYSPAYKQDTMSDLFAKTMDNIDIDVVEDVFFNSNSHKILELPLDDLKQKTIYYVNDLIHFNLRNDYFEAEEESI